MSSKKIHGSILKSGVDRSVTLYVPHPVYSFKKTRSEVETKENFVPNIINEFLYIMLFY